MPYFYDPTSSLLAFIGAALILAGLARAFHGRGRLSSVLAGLTLADAGYLAAGIGFGGAPGGSGALLLAIFNGSARLLALLCLLALQRHAQTRPNGVLAGIGKEKPLSALLFALAMFAALGISPFLTPDARPLILFAGIASQQTLLAAILTLGNAAMAVFTVRAVHELWLKGEYSFENADLRAEAATLPLPLAMAALLAAMGLFGHSLAHAAASILQSARGTLPDFAPYWHPSVLLLYAGAFGVFALGLFSRQLRNLGAILLPALALLLLFTDSALPPLSRFFGLISPASVSWSPSIPADTSTTNAATPIISSSC